MKIKPLHLELLRTLLDGLDNPERRAQYVAKDIPRCEQVKDLNKRYRWDLFYTVPVSHRHAFCDVVDEYANGDHIDTALRSLITPIV